ncbi:MAG: glycogen synthase [Oscillospiraceae bacterium]|nr:glycogen synthase [Candidatus Equicaccousia limihippi]
MKIVYLSSEAAPFVKSGGLGDVAQALPTALSKIKDNQVTLILPYYKSVKDNPAIKTEFITSYSVPLSWRNQHVGIFKLKSQKKKFQVYFIDNEYYFYRDGLYGYPDDGERFAYFSHAALSAAVNLDLAPDIIHCNDWQTALVPILLHSFYQDTLGGAKTVFTIHNIEYQGKADPYFLCDTLGLDECYTDTLTYDGCVNFMKGAILCSDSVTTVSKTYAKEIEYPYFSHGLSPIIKEHSFKMSGIVNGINTEIFNPETDKSLVQNYDITGYKEGKLENKLALQKELGLKVSPDIPMIGMVTRLVEHKGMELLQNIIDELVKWNIQLVIVGTGDKKYEDRLSACSGLNGNRFSMNLRFDPAFASRIYAASDFYLMPSKSEPCGLSQIIAMRYGTVPIVNCTGGLKDTVVPYNMQTGEGTGFNFQSFTEGDLLDCIRRGLTCYFETPDHFDRIIKNCMSKDWSWNAPAKEYMKLSGSL